LDGGEGNEDTVIAPKMPGGGSIRQAVFGHKTHGQGDDALGVMAAGGREVGQVSAEVKATGRAAVFRVTDVKIAGPVPVRATNIVEESMSEGVAIAAATALRTATPTVAPRAVFDQRPGQVLNTGNPLTAVREIFSRWHRSLSLTREGLEKAKRKQRKPSRRTRLPCYSLEKRAEKETSCISTLSWKSLFARRGRGQAAQRRKAHCIA
jgi:hypothetical protein